MSLCNDFVINVDEHNIIRLLGYRDSRPDIEILDCIRDEIKRSKNYLKPGVIYEKIGIKEIADDKVELENGAVLEGYYVAKKLRNCHHVIIMVSTIGSKIDNIIKSYFDSGDYLRGMIADNIGMYAVEYINKLFRNRVVDSVQGSNTGITPCISPGSGGWDISGQKQIFKSIDASLLGVSLTDNFLMVPLKSSSAIYGLGEGIGISRADHICSECSLKNCAYRIDDKVMVKINGQTIYAKKGDNLLEVLKSSNIYVNSICGGKGICGKCKVIFKKGTISPSETDNKYLSKWEIDSGIRLACSYILYKPIEIEIPADTQLMNIMINGYDQNFEISPIVIKKYIDMMSPSLNDQRSDCKRIKDAVGVSDMRIKKSLMNKIPEEVREGEYKVTVSLYKNVLLDIEKGNTVDSLYGVAVDIGTTTIVCYLIDMNTGKVLDVESAINRQRAYGADIVSRINFTIENINGTEVLKDLITNQINEMLINLCSRNGMNTKHISAMTIVGNTAMIHFLLGLPSKYIAISPYIPVMLDAAQMDAEELGIDIKGLVFILPGISSYVGSDISAGILSCGMAKHDGYSLLLDLGTNGEIALGNSRGIITCSTAAGPAFEGASIKYGVGGIKGAISRVDFDKDKIYETIGGIKPCGICGSGVLDMVSQLLKYKFIDETGKMVEQNAEDCPKHLMDRIKTEDGMKEFIVEDNIVFTQKDVREVQIACAAVRAGIRILMDEMKIRVNDIENIYLAGGFGNFMRVESAIRIGLLPEVFSGRIKFIGNSAGTGARMCLLSKNSINEINMIAHSSKYIELSARQDFQKYFVDSMLLGGY